MGRKITTIIIVIIIIMIVIIIIIVALQRGNAVAFQNTFLAEQSINFFTKGQAIP